MMQRTEQELSPPYNIFVARILTGALLTINIINGIVFVSGAEGLIDPYGKPLGYDFITFWSAGLLTLGGEAEAAFDLARIASAQAVAVPGLDVIYAWHYPPTFQLVVTPLALFPYIPAYIGFTLMTLVAFLATVNRLSNQPESLLWLIAFPGTIVCVMHGQNSFLTGALLAGAIFSLPSRPILAGVLIGLLAIKPQLGLLIPVALIAARQWRAFAAAAVTTLAFAALATAVFGADLWQAFFANASFVGYLMESRELDWEKMPSFFIALRLLNISESVAYAAHGVLALIAVSLTTYVWWREGPSPLASAVLVSATLLILPYVFDYELVLLAIPLMILVSDMAERGAALWEKTILPLVYVVPQFLAPVAKSTALQIGFPAIAAIFILSVYRAVSFGRHNASATTPPEERGTPEVDKASASAILDARLSAQPQESPDCR